MNGETTATQAPSDHATTAADRAESIAAFLPRTGNGLPSSQVVDESPGGDDTRNWSPPVRDEDATYYLSINRNKYDIVLDYDNFTPPPHHSRRTKNGYLGTG